MSLLQYTITNQSAIAKTFLYFSASVYHNINVGGFGTIVFNADNVFSPIQLTTGIPEVDFVSDAYIPPSGSAWLWNNGEKVQYIKISDTPLTGSNISSVINRAEWIEFSMVQAIDKNGNYLYPTSPNSTIVERYIIDNANDKGTYNSIIINDSSPLSSTAVAANSSSAGTGFSYIDQQFSIDQDCDPLLNNAVEPRPNEWLQDVDYSVNAITPINFDQLINFTATKAAVPQSNYTQLGFVNSRYAGSSTTRTQINEYNSSSSIDIENKLVYDDEAPSFFKNKGKGATLGKIPNVELNNAYIAYFNKIIDPYPILNNKVAYYVKFLVDSAGNILDPILSDTNFSVFKDTFQLRDYDNKPTRVNTAISSIDESKELLQLNTGLSSVFKMGQYPVPILYTQTSSIGYSNNIALSGSKFYSALGLGKSFTNYGIDIFATQSVLSTSDRENPVNLPIYSASFEPNEVYPFINNNVIPTSSINNDVLLLPLDPNGTPSSTNGGLLSNNYNIRGSYQFTTSAIPCKYLGRDSKTRYYIDYDGRKPTNSNILTFKLKPFKKPPNLSDSSISNYSLNTIGFNIKKVILSITSNPGTNTAQNYRFELQQTPSGNYNDQWKIDPNDGFVFTPNSLYIEDLIIQNVTKVNDVRNANARRQVKSLIGGGWDTDGGNVYGYGGIPIKYDWIIEFEFTNLYQNSGLYLKAEGNLVSQDGSKNADTWPKDVFLFYGAKGETENNLQWKRTFTPIYASGISSQPILKYTVTSPLSENAVKNQASGPFWRRVDGTIDELYMSSSILNQTYGKSFIQAKLPYNGAVSTDFPLTIEPGFMEFDPISDIWELQPGDEIRFENDETLVYTIIEKEGRNSIYPPSEEQQNDKLKIVVNPPFEYTGSDGNIIVYEPSNFDFFVVRRYKDNKNFVILDQQMPYGFSYGNGIIDYSGEDVQAGVEPVTRASSPGILLPEHRIEVFNQNPDLILKDLIEKKII